MKKSSSRSQRGSKGIKGKHILQICVLLGICIWLIYQVKYSNDKKKEFYEKDSKKSTELLEGVDGVVKFGRKDLPGGYQVMHQERRVEDEDEEEIGNGEDEKDKEKEKATKSKLGNGSHEEEEEEEVEEEEEDKNKQVEEDEVDDEENKHGEDDEREDVIDEQDQNRIGETDRDNELLEEDNGSKDANVDEVDMSVHEAREEHYKADDASSAVSHESRVLNTEKQNETSGQSNVTSQVKIEKEPILKLGEAESGDLVDKTATEVRDGGSDSSSSDHTKTKTAATDLKDESVNRNLTIEASGFGQNETETGQEHDKLEDVAPLARSSYLEQPSHESDPNIAVSANITRKDFIQDESRNLTSESTVNKNISGSNTTMVTENSESEVYDGKESSNLDSADQTEETDDTSETRISMEEREALTDPQTLPDLRTEENEEEEEALGAE